MARPPSLTMTGCATPSEPQPNTDVWLDTHFFRGANGLLKLLEFFDDDDNRLAKLAPEKRDPHKRAVLVAVANDETLRVLVHGKRRDQLRLAARLETEMKLPAGIDNFFNHFSYRIDPNRENAAVFVATATLRHRSLKGA